MAALAITARVAGKFLRNDEIVVIDGEALRIVGAPTRDVEGHVEVFWYSALTVSGAYSRYFAVARDEKVVTLGVDPQEGPSALLITHEEYLEVIARRLGVL